MTATSEAFVQLLDEGVDVWRPTRVRDLGDGTFLMLETPPSDERWEFEAPQVVRRELRSLSEGTCLVVTTRA